MDGEGPRPRPCFPAGRSSDPRSPRRAPEPDPPSWSGAAESIRRSQKLEAVGQLTGGVAHELGTALQCVSNNLEFLNSAFDDLSTVARTARDHPREGPARTARRVPDTEVDYLIHEIPHSLEGAERALRQAARIVTALRDVSVPSATPSPRASRRARIRASDRSSAEFPRFDLNRGLQSAIAVAEARIRHTAQIQARLADLPPIIWRGNDLIQVFLHLLINAAEAIEAAGRPALGSIRVWTALREPHVQVGFQDDGCGIAREVQDRIFEPFFTTKPSGEGTGQGLAFARTVVQSQGGSIDVDSQEGCGTTVVLYIPQKPPDLTSEPGTGSAS